MTARYFKTVYIICLLFSIAHTLCFAQDYLPFKGIIQVESNVSDGAYSPFKVVSLAQEKGIKIVIFTDSYLRRWEYGIWPLPNLIKLKKEQPSVVQYGIKKYLKEIDNLNRQFPDMVVLSGVEVAPFYWWEGNPFKEKISNFGWGKHLLVIGLNSKDYEYLPVVSKRYFLPQNFKDTVSVIVPILIIFIAGSLLKLEIERMVPLFPYQLLGYIVIILAIIFLLNNFPFSSTYDAYHQDKGYKPYQEFIDYVHKKGGFVSWAHPGMEYSQSLGKINIFTLKYFDVLTNTFDYNAFAGLYGGDVSSCFANKQWDTLLKEFCLNKRKNPVWATGEIDYDGNGPIDAIQTVFFLSKLNRDSVFEALKKGGFYSRIYNDNFYIDLKDFSLEDKIMGETAQIENKPKLIIRGNAHIHPEAKIRLELIRNGEIAAIFEIKNGEFDLEFIDDTFTEFFPKNYYRLNFLSGDRLILISNPIFYEVKQLNNLK